MHVFLSYSRNDIAYVSPFVALLRCAGVTVFLDIDSIEYGTDWKQAIESALAMCDRVIVIWSVSASESKWVTREFSEAKNQQKRIVPVMLDNTPLPATLADLHGCEDLVPLVTSFKDSIDRHQSRPDELYEEQLGSARRETGDLFTRQPPPRKTTGESNQEKLTRVRKPRVHIIYDVEGASDSIDVESLQIAERAVTAIQHF